MSQRSRASKVIPYVDQLPTELVRVQRAAGFATQAAGIVQVGKVVAQVAAKVDPRLMVAGGAAAVIWGLLTLANKDGPPIDSAE